MAAPKIQQHADMISLDHVVTDGSSLDEGRPETYTTGSFSVLLRQRVPGPNRFTLA